MAETEPTRRKSFLVRRTDRVLARRAGTERISSKRHYQRMKHVGKECHERREIWIGGREANLKAEDSRRIGA